MPVVDVDPDELRELTGHEEKSDDELKDDLFGLGLEFEGMSEDGEFQLEFAPDRLDRLSVEGVARSLRYQYGDASGIYVPDTNDAEWTIEVDESVPDERPYVTGAIVRGVDLSGGALESLIQLQEKLHATMGRKRAKGAIGIHDLTMIKGRSARSADERVSSPKRRPADDRAAEPRDDGGTATESHDPDATDAAASNSITYRGVDPNGDTFVPLDDDAERTPAAVLTEHPTGEQYADLLTDYERYPAIYDDLGLFSFPPVINGRRTEVTEDSRDLLVELTGTDQWTIDRMCNIICYALDARGGTIEDVTVSYLDLDVEKPDFETDEKVVTHERIESTLGIDLTEDDVLDLLGRAGLGAESEDWGEQGTDYVVEIPPYRTDVLHPVDVVDDVGRAYGFNDLVPRYPDVSTVGGRTERSRLERAVRETLVGLGHQDLLNFHLTNEAENYDRMGLSAGSDVVGGGEPATIAEPYSEDYTIVRTWALPSLVALLENNTHRAYPQDVAEVGFAAERDDSNTGVAERRTVAGAVVRHDASYEDAKARLQVIARDFDVDLETPATTHPSFIDGRTASVVIDGETVGVVGEVHPEVLVEHDLEVPVAAFEFRLDALAD
ncbi:phenylalanine--tRNA ligase subunit beta [Halarchaeum nitratireducens]|uniref:Phenylalanine--tRNA ligase beta subunit n=1 Tax=Halarchaeum nitratireducens TaxID=489913 RepID=A0A830GEX0_9EURY|nr:MULTISPECIES: phenylalanine--tRNA ligase subunit beta [Halarchaeum]MBP2252854.1 phenylalanyl-tRNA synthetase beta chain [Halarchaeum solikamskense]GGN26525.1 phenylalanine--tRNA ligase subunit beta [Halarchaeum nitratireducens]